VKTRILCRHESTVFGTSRREIDRLSADLASNLHLPEREGGLPEARAASRKTLDFEGSHVFDC